MFEYQMINMKNSDETIITLYVICRVCHLNMNQQDSQSHTVSLNSVPTETQIEIQLTYTIN